MEETPSIKFFLSFGYGMESNRHVMFGTKVGNEFINVSKQGVDFVPYIVVGITQSKVRLMYQHRKKFNSLNSLHTSFANHHWQ
jgi:hypothetical protein